jgi:hypothetical protein
MYLRPNSKLFVLFCLIIYSHTSNFFNYLAPVTITGKGAANLDLFLALMTYSSESPFTCHTCCDTGSRYIRSHPRDRYPHPSVYTVSSEGPASASHSGIQTCDVRIIRSLRLRYNHCTTRATLKLIMS